LRWLHREVRYTSTELGSMMPPSASAMPNSAVPSPPALRPTFHPMRAVKRTLGPGAACAMAMEALNWGSVSHAFSCTRKRCMSGAVVIAPPTHRSDSDR
jgi:hypothetical protein